MAQVKFENVDKVFDNGVKAVSGMSLDVRDGEFLVLVGPSGCGKTTALRMVAGLEAISSGTVSIGDTVVNELSSKDRDIAMVFQNYALYPHMNVRENMAFGLKLRRFPKEEIERRVNEAAEILGIQTYLHRKPKELSGGQRQRVAVGRAIVRKPKAFLFDEPLSNLDAKMRVQMRTEISKLHQRLNSTMIYVTHDQVEAMTMGDRIVVMKDGVIQQVAAPLEIYNSPANQFVAGFIGSPPMNFFKGRLEAANNSISFNEGSFSVTLPEQLASKVAGRVGQEIVFGIRPEDIAEDAAGAVTAKVEVVEPMGAETYIYLNTGRHSFIARVGATHTAAAGHSVTATFDAEKAHLFDPQSGATVA